MLAGIPTSLPGKVTNGVVAPYLAIEAAYKAALASIAKIAPFVALDLSLMIYGKIFNCLGFADNKIINF
jgi:hypothetical protein